jgi:eukaryotic-like serine/threonine-protein kinase
MHATGATPRIVDELADPRLLAPARFDVLVDEILPHCDDWVIIGRELVYRGWLTPYQARQVLRGHGDELILGSYVLLEPVGEGGMGIIYQARNWKLDTPAAVKVIRRDRAADPAAVERFLREVRALGAIRHPHVVHALDADVENGRLYCAMEFVPGTDLGQLLRDRGALPVETACRYAAQLADGLHHISGLGLVHRDIKPGNVLVAEDGSGVKLTDLGLARFDSPEWGEVASDLTSVGMMVGTPDYVAPEQIRDSRAADIRSDLYSLGCTLYHMLAGRPPFAGLSTVDKLGHHQSAAPTPIEEVRPEVPASVATIVRTLLEKRPRDRYQDPAELLAVLRPYLHAAGETVTDASAPTSPGLPVPMSEPALPRTEEIPIDGLSLVTSETDPAPAARFTWRAGVMHWLDRLHWLIAAVIAGLAMGLIIGRG